MTAKQLTDSILQMAIQGKLVPQDPNDEPASVLLEHIREKKRRLVTEGKLKKKELDVLPITEDEIPFDIPEGWEWVRLCELLEIISDGTHKTPQYVPVGVPFLSVQNISSGKLTLDRIKYISEEEHKILIKRIKPQKGDILLCRIGTLGKALKVTWDFDFSIFVSLGLLRPLIDVITDYVVFCINSPLGTKWILDKRVGGGTHTYKINLEDIPNFILPLPPIDEQYRIVEKVEEYLPIIKEYGKAYDEASKMDAELPDKLKKSILQEAIMGKLGTQDPSDAPASCLLENIRAEKQRLIQEGLLKKKDLVETQVEDDEVPFNIPESWTWVKIDTLFQHSSGKQLKGGDNEGELHQYITTSNLYWDKFILDNLKSMYYKSSELDKCTAKKGDLLVCEGGDVGRCAIWPYDYNICLQNHVHRLRPYYGICTRLVMYILMLYKAKGYIGGKGIGIKGLSASALKNYCIPLPPLAEQYRIVQKIEELYAEIDNMTVENNININEIEETEED